MHLCHACTVHAAWLLCFHRSTRGPQPCLHLSIREQHSELAVCTVLCASHSYISIGATICGPGSPRYSPVEAEYWAKARVKARPSRRRGALQPAVFIVVAVAGAKFLELRELGVDCCCLCPQLNTPHRLCDSSLKGFLLIS